VVNNAARRVLGPLPLRFHDRMRSGERVSRLTTDVGRVLVVLVALTTTLVPDLLLVASILVVLATLDVELALVGISVVPAPAWFAVGRRRRVRRAQQAARAASGRVVVTSQNLLRNVRAIPAFDRVDRAHDHLLASDVDRTVLLGRVPNDPEPRHRRTPPGPAVATPMPVLIPVGRRPGARRREAGERAAA